MTNATQSPDNASVLQDKDIERLVNAQKKPVVDANLPLKDKVDQMKSAKRLEAEKLKTGRVGVNPFDSTYPKEVKQEGVNNSKNNSKPATNNNQNNATPASSTANDTATFMTGNTSAAIDCLMNGTSTSTPVKNVNGQANMQQNTHTNGNQNTQANTNGHSASTHNTSNDSLGTQKATSFPGHHPNITHILSGDESSEFPHSQGEAPQQQFKNPKKPSNLLPTTVLTDNKTPTFPPSPDYLSDVSFDNNKTPYNFAKQNRTNHGSDVSTAVENARRIASQARRSALHTYKDQNPTPAHSYLHTASNYMEKIRTEVDKDHAREKKLARERLARKQQQRDPQQKNKNFDTFQTPQTKGKLNVQVPLDMTEEQLFEVICKLTSELDKSQDRVREVEELMQQFSEQLNEQSVVIDSLKNQREEDNGQKEVMVGQLQQQLRHVTESKDSELRHVNQAKDAEIAQLKLQVQQLTAQLASSSVSDVNTLKHDYEHYKHQCYKKDGTISDLEARLKREENLDEFETKLKEKEKRLIKTELRLGQQALEQDHDRQKLDAEKKVYEDKDEEERLRQRLRELNGRESRSSRESRSHDRYESRGSRSSRSRSRDRSYRSRDRSRDRSVSRSRSRSRYRRRSEPVKEPSKEKTADLRAQALEKVVDYLMNRQKAGAQRAHMDACYNVAGPGERYSDGLSDATVETVLKEFLDKDEAYLKDLLEGDGKKLDEYLGRVYAGVSV